MTAYNAFPSKQTNSFAGGAFTKTTNGYIQGHALPDPATMFELRQGYVADGETFPLYAGVAITEKIGKRGSRIISRATSAANITGFTVANQNNNAVVSGSSNVPTVGSGQSISYFSLGSRARIPLPCSSSLVSAIGEQVNTPVNYDFTGELLIPGGENAATSVSVTGAVWANTSGGQITFTLSSAISPSPIAGDSIDVSGITATGSTGGSYNGTFTVVSVSGSTIVVSAPANSNNFGAYSSGGSVVFGGAAIPVTILEVIPEGNLVVNNNFPFTYNCNGAIALVQLTGGTTA